MAKRRGKGEELVPGVPMREALEFLCRHSGAFDREGEPEREDDRIDFLTEFGFRESKDAAIQAMLSKGWLVEAKSKQPKARMRYRVTEAGKRLGRESAPLFKWPAIKSAIKPPVGRLAGLVASCTSTAS